MRVAVSLIFFDKLLMCGFEGTRKCNTVTSDIDLSVLGWRYSPQDNSNCFLLLRVISVLQRSR